MPTSADGVRHGVNVCVRPSLCAYTYTCDDMVCQAKNARDLAAMARKKFFLRAMVGEFSRKARKNNTWNRACQAKTSE